jgi:hypothetical protein
MAKVTLRRGEQEFMVEDLTFEQVKELIGVNGYGSHSAPGPTETPALQLPRLINREPNFYAFVGALSIRGKTFIDILKHHSEGIEANELAGKLGYKDAKQIGGLTGGGLAKIAKRFNVKLKDVYDARVSFQGEKRTVTFFPAKYILAALAIEQEKPA